MVLAYGALAQENTNLKKLIEENKKTLDYFISKQKKINKLEETKAVFYKKEKNLQSKIMLQLQNLAKSLLQKKCPVTSSLIPCSLWGHLTIKKEYSVQLVKQKVCDSPPSLYQQQDVTDTSPLLSKLQSYTKNKNSDHAFITKMSRVTSRLEEEYGGPPPPSSRPNKLVVPSDFCDLWANLFSFDRNSPPVSTNPKPTPSSKTKQYQSSNWSPLPPKPFRLESLLKPRYTAPAPAFHHWQTQHQVVQNPRGPPSTRSALDDAEWGGGLPYGGEDYVFQGMEEEWTDTNHPVGVSYNDEYVTDIEGGLHAQEYFPDQEYLAGYEGGPQDQKEYLPGHGGFLPDEDAVVPDQEEYLTDQEEDITYSEEAQTNDSQNFDLQSEEESLHDMYDEDSTNLLGEDISETVAVSDTSEDHSDHEEVVAEEEPDQELSDLSGDVSITGDDTDEDSYDLDNYSDEEAYSDY